jgi:hypothetical protein
VQKIGGTLPSGVKVAVALRHQGLQNLAILARLPSAVKAPVALQPQLLGNSGWVKNPPHQSSTARHTQHLAVCACFDPAHERQQPSVFVVCQKAALSGPLIIF